MMVADDVFGDGDGVVRFGPERILAEVGFEVMLCKDPKVDTGVGRRVIGAHQEPVGFAPCIPLFWEITDKSDALDLLHSAAVGCSDAITQHPDISTLAVHRS